METTAKYSGCRNTGQTITAKRHIGRGQACIAKSEADFYHKIKICQEEADESILWIEYLIEGEILPEHKLSSLLDEARQLAAIMTASSLTIHKRLHTNK